MLQVCSRSVITTTSTSLCPICCTPSLAHSFLSSCCGFTLLVPLHNIFSLCSDIYEKLWHLTYLFFFLLLFFLLSVLIRQLSPDCMTHSLTNFVLPPFTLCFNTFLVLSTVSYSFCIPGLKREKKRSQSKRE